MLARVLSRKSYAVAGILALAAGAVHAQTFPGPGGEIPDSPATGTPGVLTTTITVPAGTGNIVSFNNVALSFGTGTLATPRQHTWAGDLAAILTAPNGDDAHVMVRVGGTSSTSFGDSSDLSGSYTFVNSGGADFLNAASLAGTGATIPNGSYNRFTNAAVAPRPPIDNDDFTVFNGDNAAGVWTLTIQDWTGGDTGTLTGWSINVTVPEPASAGLLVGAAALPLLRRRRR